MGVIINQQDNVATLWWQFPWKRGKSAKSGFYAWPGTNSRRAYGLLSATNPTILELTANLLILITSSGCKEVFCSVWLVLGTMG